MPHQCDDCEHIVENGTDVLQSGCPACGGGTFLYLATAPQAPEPSTDDIIDGEDPIEHPMAEDSAQHSARSDIMDADELGDGVFGRVANGLQARDDADETSTDEAEEPTVSDYAATTDAPPVGPVEEPPVAEKQAVRDTAALTTALNEEFESIVIVEPGKYELNLQQLFERDESIIRVLEDGRYSIQFPDR
jgi:hypothetical protein